MLYETQVPRNQVDIMTRFPEPKTSFLNSVAIEMEIKNNHLIMLLASSYPNRKKDCLMFNLLRALILILITILTQYVSWRYFVPKRVKFPLPPMGVLAPGSAHARPSARPPIDTRGNFSAHMSWGYNCLKVFLINFLAKSENSKHFSFFF